MSARAARIAALLAFALYGLAVTWPAYLPFNRVRPLILGLPFSMAWICFWIVMGGVVLFVLDRGESRARGEPREPREPGQ
ncbi:MAG: DUF3311 domain-containing protein [Gemmatimonadetes bacterium]|nr:DUF3311 domain-containing protein [Gemmatimonadota bacterium]